MTLAIRPEEYAARRTALAARLDERGLAGAVLFDPHHVSYYTGFAFIPTERPIAFALAADGRGGMLVPRLEVEHARANAAVQEVAHYDEYPGDRHPLRRCSSCSARSAVRGAIGDTTIDASARSRRRAPLVLPPPRLCARSRHRCASSTSSSRTTCTWRRAFEMKKAACAALFVREIGGDLLSREVALRVPSALAGLTSLFGMGRGVSPPV